MLLMLGHRSFAGHHLHFHSAWQKQLLTSSCVSMVPSAVIECGGIHITMVGSSVTFSGAMGMTCSLVVSLPLGDHPVISCRGLLMVV